MVWISFGMLVVTGLGVVLIAATLSETRKATVAMMDANSLMAETNYLQLRAYLSIVDVEGSAEPAKDGMAFMLSPFQHRVRIRVRVKVRNSGQTPAKSVTRYLRLLPSPVYQAADGGDGVVGLSASRVRLDIGPGQTFVLDYAVVRTLVVPAVTLGDILSPQAGPKLFVEGAIEYSDYAGNRWNIPYSCRTFDFRPDVSEPTELKFERIEQAEEQRLG
jgi:hypothetical protein